MGQPLLRFMSDWGHGNRSALVASLRQAAAASTDVAEAAD